MKLNYLYVIALFVALLSGISATKSPKKVSQWVASLGRAKKKTPMAIGNEKRLKKKNNVIDENSINDLINADKMTEKANRNANLPEDEQKRIEKMEEEGKKRQYSMEFNKALDTAQKNEEQLKGRDQKRKEEIAKAKQRNATRHAEQLFKKQERRIEERNKTQVRHEQNIKRDAVLEMKEKAQEAKRNEQANKQARVRKIKMKWSLDHYNAEADIRRNMITDVTQNYTDCTNGNGKFDNKTMSCKCHPGFEGPLCAYKVLHTRHGHGRFVGNSECEHGEPYADGSGCNCTEGFEGFHCHFKKCVHGKKGCPKRRKYCVRQKCICEKGWLGMFCDTQPPPPPKPTPAPKPCGGKIFSCLHDGVFSYKTCQCECKAPWLGKGCQTCNTKQVERLNKYFIIDETNCTSVCPLNRTDKICKNGGKMDRETCQCKCKDKRHVGPNCETCAKRSCNGHGIFDKKSCSCLCEVPFRSSTDCATCDLLECGKNGYFDPTDCKCKCYGGWTGLNCDICEAPKANKLTGDVCTGGRLWNPIDCKCSDQCKPIRCLHGGKQDPLTCKCRCNPGSESADLKLRDIAVQEFKHIVRARFGTASPVTSAVNKALVNFVQGNSEAGKTLEQLKKYIETTPHEDVLHAYESFKDKIGNTTVAVPPSNSDYTMNDQDIMDRIQTRVSTPRSINTTQKRRASKVNNNAEAVPPKAMSFKSTLASLLPSFGSSFLETVESTKISVVDNSTYWTGSMCQICTMPDKIPCAEGEVFDLTKCGCSHECPKPELTCLNGGKIDEGTCHCRCMPGYGGNVCQFHLDGLTRKTAVHSCKQLLRLNPETPSGGYWIKPKKHTEPFLTKCDMAMDGGGWTQLAKVSGSKEINFDSISYMEGVTPSNSASLNDDFILPCTHFDGLDDSKSLHRFIVRVSMGSVRDYFKLVDEQNSNLCDMLTSDDKHLWSANGGGMGSSMPQDKANIANTGWLQPQYSDISAVKILGGSNETWPLQVDGRKYLSIWGGFRGGCCHYSSNIYPDDNGHGVDPGQWGRGFAIHVKEMPYIEPDHPLLDDKHPALDKQPAPQSRKEEVKESLSDELSPKNLFSVKSKSKIPNMLTDGGPKKEFMNTMFIEDADKNRQQATRSLESELPWFDANKAMNLE